jgi:hypothetical protein
MVPSLQAVTGRQNTDTAITFPSGPSRQLDPVFGCGIQEEIDIRVVHFHLIVFVFQREVGTPGGEGMVLLWFSRDGALWWMSYEYASHQVSERGEVFVQSCSRMEKQDAVSLPDIVDEGASVSSVAQGFGSDADVLLALEKTTNGYSPIISGDHSVGSATKSNLHPQSPRPVSPSRVSSAGWAESSQRTSVRNFPPGGGTCVCFSLRFWIVLNHFVLIVKCGEL